ncbi:MAG: HAMP domain-containing histidine kinase [Eubacterium sp.]|nr:HAMP domain-containing histidine kinase [Eubacterium sp.]
MFWKIKNLSIRKTILLYFAATMAASYVCGYFLVRQAGFRQEQVWMKYAQDTELYGSGYVIRRPEMSEMSRADMRISELCDFLQTYGILVISFVGMTAAVSLFYRRKLKEPLSVLTKASAAIAENHLDMAISYENKDEMGQLCRAFEAMRRQLFENNKKLWNMIEQEKEMRSAIAHDIRSPLAVLKGYQEMLLELVPGETLDRVLLLDMLEEGMVQIQRMENFLDTMKKLSSLEEREIKPQETTLLELEEKYQKSMGILAAGSQKVCEVLVQDGASNENAEAYFSQKAEHTEYKILNADVELITEVLENLCVNALRYARTKVTVRLSLQGEELWIEVQDDGPGFTEHAQVLTKPYYHANPKDDLTHFGLGLYICRVYCQKHGGRLLLGNQKSGGGTALAVFRV